jgi:hypothetical protein
MVPQDQKVTLELLVLKEKKGIPEQQELKDRKDHKV